MIELFKSIYEKEKNEATAFVLMLGVLSEKLTEIINLLEDIKKENKKPQPTFEKTHLPLSAEDYD